MRIYSALAVLLILGLSGCSTKKNTLLNRSYHNVTAHYNVYFNGNESYKKGMKKLSTGLQDDYLELLSIFPPVGKVGESPVSSDMDKAIKKGTKLITFHSITAKPNYKRGIQSERQKAFYNKKEYNNWVDDAYLLIGKSHFNNYNLNLAEETFRHVIQNFPDEDTHFEASVWLARTLTEENELTQARLMLEEISANTKFPKRQKSFLYASFADCYIKLKNLPLAAEMLEKAVKFERTKATRVRYYYILAQLYQRTGNFASSSAYYDKVVRANPNYTMTFNATISRASVSGSSNAAESVREQLKKLLRDSKNKEYNDQIYFALGNLDLQANKKKDAIGNYAKSAQVSTSNLRQKVRSYVALADIYYADREYVPASAFYDSAMLAIDEKFPNYNEVVARSKNLSALVVNLNKANFEDSVQRIAAMSETDRNTFIDNIIKDVVKKEELARAEELAEQERLANIGSDNSNQQFSNQIAGGKWYFYNQASKSFGQAEFIKKWGKRTLEDNWRRKNKTASTSSITSTDEKDSQKETDGTGQASKGKGKTKLNNKTREYYTRNLPLTDSAKAASTSKMQEALFNAGMVYRDKLKEPLKAIEILETLNKRFSSYPLKLETVYQLYELNRLQGNSTMMEMYKRVIMSEFPNSIYASLLGDPNYIQRLREKQHAVEQHYTDTYAAFNAGNMSEVVSRANSVLNSKENNQYRSHYALLNAMAIGKISGIDSFRVELTKVKENYKGTEEAKKAQEIIASIDLKKPDLKQKEIEKKAETTYSASLNEQHVFVWFIPTGEGSANQLNFNLINYNLDTYHSTSLNVAILELTTLGKMVVVGKFGAGTEALNYLDNMDKAPNILVDTDIKAPIRFIITPTNLEKLRTDGDVGAYIAFFRKTYKR